MFALSLCALPTYALPYVRVDTGHMVTEPGPESDEESTSFLRAEGGGDNEGWHS